MTARLSFVLSVLSLLWISSVGFAEDEQLQKYKDIWAATRPKVESGIIHYKQYSGANLLLHEHDKVRDLLKQMKDRDDYSAIVREVACALNNAKVPDNAPEYPEQVLYFKEDKLRIERYEGIEIFNDGLFIKARHVKVNDRSMQININDKNGRVLPMMEHFWDFYPVPSAEVTDTMSVVTGQTDTDRIECSQNRTYLLGASLIVAKNGDILEIISGETKRTSSERLFFAFKEFDGVRLTQLVFKGTYVDGGLTSATVSAIVDAQFNVTIDDNLFVQDAKGGDVIVDERVGKGRSQMLKNDVADVTQ